MTTPSQPHSNYGAEHHPPVTADPATPDSTPPTPAIRTYKDFWGFSFAPTAEMQLAAAAIVLTAIAAIIANRLLPSISYGFDGRSTSFPIWSTIATSLALLAAAAAVAKSWASLLIDRKPTLLPATLATANIFFAAGLALYNLEFLYQRTHLYAF